MKIPKIKLVEVLKDFKLKVFFDNEEIKEYDCQKLFQNPNFLSLKNLAYFKSVQIDPKGYGLSWGSDLDISEYELWKNGSCLNHD